MEKPIIIEVTDENANEVLMRKQKGENICSICVNSAFELIKAKIFNTQGIEQ